MEEDEEEDDEEEEEEEEDVGTDCCGLVPFLSAVGGGDGAWAVCCVLGACEGSAGAGEESRAGDDCFDVDCCFSLSSADFSGGLSLFLRRGSSFCSAGLGLGPESDVGVFTGLRPSFFSDFFFLSFFPFPCF